MTIVLRFPHRRSVGTLFVAPLSQPEEWELLSQVRGLVVMPENQPIRWEWLEEARGNVALPAGCKVKLKVSGKGSGSLAPLTELPADAVHTLDLSRSEVSDISLSRLTHLTGLKVLELTATNITDAGLLHLESLVNLQGLGLSHCKISGVGLRYLRDLKQLRELWMSSAAIGDADLEYLSLMTELVQLGLSGTNITDAGLHYLAQIKSLMRIYLFNTEITQAGFEELRQQLPGCRLKWKPVQQVDETLRNVDPSASLEQLLAGLPDDVRSAFQLPLDAAERSTQQGLGEECFWQIMDLLDWEQTGNDDAVIEPAVNGLAARKDQDILAFADILSEKLHYLDGEAFAREIGRDSFRGPDYHFSKNCFLSARCCVIANGREFYEEVIADPMKMPKDMEFEALLKIPSRAYQRKTGKKLTYITKYSFQTYANKNGWPNYA